MSVPHGRNDMMADPHSKSILRDLEDGVTVIADRYAFSGIAFTAAKVGLAALQDLQLSTGPAI